MRISAGQIHPILLSEAASLQSGQRAAHRAGMEHSPYAGIDGTFTQCDGEPRVCHTIGNEVFSTFATTAHKDRVSVIGASEETCRHLREPTALSWLDRTLPRRPAVMLSDGGTNYHGILASLQRCWIHALRPFSHLAPTPDSHRVLNEGWVLYRRITAWRREPDASVVAALEREFDHVFDPARCTDSAVRDEVQTIVRNRATLLTVLRHPYVPPENNGQERSANARARMQDGSIGPRSERGLRAWDTMQSVFGTLRKLGVSPNVFLHDRITHRGSVPRLDTLVRDACERRFGHTAPPGRVRWLPPW